MTAHLSETKARLSVIALAKRCAQLGWTPATAGNFSVRVDDTRIAITRSGVDKGALTESDILILPLNELPPREASAEAPIHWSIYRQQPKAGAVAHAHPPATTALSLMPYATPHLVLEGLELLKVLPGFSTHAARLEVPVRPNTQDMTGLAAELNWQWQAPALILAGHGVYAWGADAQATFKHLEALEAMFDLEFRRRQLAR